MNHFRNWTLHPEMHEDGHGARLNWLRAAVLGANDGIVSVAALIVGVAGATAELPAIVVAGVAGILSGALSMAVGEYVSVSSQRDAEEALLEKERHELEHYPQEELEELTTLYMHKGLSPETARQVATELTEHDVFAAHAEAELRLDPGSLTSAWYAAFASGLSFVAGAVIPFAAMVLLPEGARVAGTFIAVIVALAATGVLSARLSGGSVLKVVLRVVGGGILAMVVTFGIGRLFGVAVL